MKKRDLWPPCPSFLPSFSLLVLSRDRISSMHYHPDMGAVVLIPIKLFGSDTNLAVGRSPCDHDDSRLSILLPSPRPDPLARPTLPPSFIRSFQTKSKRLNPTYKWTPRRLLSSRLPTPPGYSCPFRGLIASSRCPQILESIRPRELDHPFRPLPRNRSPTCGKDYTYPATESCFVVKGLSILVLSR